MALSLPKDYALIEGGILRPGVGKHLAAVAKHVASSEGEMPLEELKPILRILLGCLPRSYDPVLRRSSTAIWDALLEKRMGKTVADACLATLTVASKRIDDGGRTMTCFAWSCKLASQAALQEGGHLSADAAFGKLAQLQFAMFSRIAGEGKPDMAKGSASCFSSMLRRKVNKDGYAKYLEVLKSCKDPSEVAGGVSLLLGQKGAADQKAKFVELYRTSVMDATEGREGRVASPLITEAFRPLFKMLSHDDFEPLVPDMCRVLRRTPDLYMKSLAASIMHLSVDASRYVEKFSGIVTERLSSEKLREDTLSLTASLAKQSSDLSTLVSMGSEIVKRLSGKDVRNWQERIGLVRGLSLLLTLPKGKGNVPLAEEATKTVVQLADKEANDETKSELLLLLGVCLRKTESLPGDVAKVIAKQLENGGDAIRRSAINCIGDVMACSDLRLQAGELVPALCKLVSTAEKKPGFRGDAILATRVLLSLATGNDDAEAQMEKDGFFQIVTSPSSFFAEMSVSPSLTTAEGVALADVTDSLIVHHSARLSSSKGKSAEGGPAAVYSVFAGLLAHADYGVYSAAAGAIRRTHGSEPSTVKGIIDGLHALIRAEGAMERAEAESAAMVPTHCSVRFKRALLAAVPGVPPAEMLGQLILIAHSPVMLSGPNARNAAGQVAAWGLIAQRYPKENGGFEAAMRSSVPALCGPLLGELGIRGSQFDRECALGALETLAKYAVEDVLPKVLEAIEGDMDAETATALTDQDIVIFRTPEGELAKFEELSSGYVPQEQKEQNIKISKEEKKLYGALAKEFAAEKAAKKKDEKPKMTKQEEEVFKGRLREEAAVRESVASVKASIELALSVLGALCRGNPSGMHASLARIAPLIWPLCKVARGLVQAPVKSMICEMARCSSARLSPQVPEGLYTVAAVKPDDMWGENAANTKAALKALVADLAGYPLTVESFVLVLPLLRFAIRNPSVGSELQDVALKTVGQHTSASEAWPRTEIIGMLVGVMTANARVRKAASDIVLKHAANLGPVMVDELLDGCLSPEAAVRGTCVDSLMAIPGIPGPEPHLYLHATVFLMCHDADEAVQAKAKSLSDLIGTDPSLFDTSQLTELLSHASEGVRKMAADSLASLLKAEPGAAQETVSQLKALYLESKGAGIFTRSGVALALSSIAEYLSKREIIVLFPTLVSDKDQGLTDPDDGVRAQMMAAGLRLIELHGQGCMELLTPMFENQLNKGDTGTWQGDLLKEGVVIFLATLSKFLPKGDPKVAEVMRRLMHALTVPSESVQRAAATCMTPLMNMLGDADAVSAVVRDDLQMLLESDNYGDRRGAAFGLAGIVKGLGISALKAHDIMPTLQSAAADKKDPVKREGALFGFEALSEKLGRLFEPYVIHILPILLNSCGDADQNVREAAELAAKAVMSQLSGQGVKLVMPALLQGVEDRTWRTKSAAVDLLGAMAYCAPKQLGTCLPTIVPVLASAVADTHIKVREGAKAALSQVGAVIKNPEINAIANQLIASMSDPEQMPKALEQVIETTFVNAVDAPSLALLVPVVQRGLKHRSTDLKKKAATIVGNMCNLVADPKDVSPYLNDLVPILKSTILDPSPEVRSQAAQALGSLVKSMDEAQYEELERYLLLTMKSDESMVERQGAAQGLGEVLGASTVERFENVLPEIMMCCSSKLPHIREGYLTVMMCLPVAMGDALGPFIPKILPTILAGLSDEMEAVREIALKAGHNVVDNYADTAMPLVLPAIEKGLFDEAWRIRASSVHLLGDVMSKITGRNWKIYSGGAVMDEDEGTGDRTTEAKIAEVLGVELRDKLFSAIYMLRSDVAPTVCQASFQVWKSVVQSQLRTLRTILPVLMDTLIECLSSGNQEKQHVAGSAMGELINKMGDRALPDVIPILQKCLRSDNEEERSGVCLGIGEVIANCTKNQIYSFLDDLVSTVRNALCDAGRSVRASAARAFDALFKQLGQRAIEEVVPSLLEALDEPGSNALEGLQQLLSIRGKIILPFLIPQLSAPPMTASNARALAALAEVAGEALSSRIPSILGALSDGMEEGDDPESIAASAEKVVNSVPQDGVRLMLLELIRRLEDVTTAKTRSSSARLITAFVSSTSLDYEDYIHQIIKALVHLHGDADEEVQAQSGSALKAMVAAMEKKDKVEDEKAPAVSCGTHVVTVLEEVQLLGRGWGEGNVPGFNRAKGLEPVLPFFLQALMHGTPETREQAAEGLGELVKCTSEAALKPMVVKMSGPLIRIMGDRFPWQVKAAILQTLLQLLVKGGIMMKPFLPQLQTIFIKSLSENSKVVRSLSVRALAKLVTMSPRVDPLLNDLVSGCKTSEGGVKISFIQALEVVLGNGGKSATKPVLATVVIAVEELMGSDDDDVRATAAAAFGAYTSSFEDAEMAGLVGSLLDDRQDWIKRHGRSLACASLIRHLVSTSRWDCASALEPTLPQFKTLAGDDRAPVREAASHAVGRLVMLARAGGAGDGGEVGKKCWSMLAKLVADSSPEVKIMSLTMIKSIAKSEGGISEAMVSEVIVSVYQSLKDKNTSVRTVAERAMLHVAQLYDGLGVIEPIAARLKETDQVGVMEYCKRAVAKGVDANAASDDEEE